MNSPETYDVIIIGAGAAGLMAAASAAGRGKRVLLLEKNTKLGVKILMSGGTRCNITHDCGVAGIIAAFGRNGKFLHSALAALSPKSVIEKIESVGVATKIESTGKIFPVSNKAIDVRDALVTLATTAGAKIWAASSVAEIKMIDRHFQVAVSSEKLEAPTVLNAEKVIITTGGKSYPGCGTTGDGYAWAVQFGHKIVDTYPALTPIISDCAWARELKGITIERVGVRVREIATPASLIEFSNDGGTTATKTKSKPTKPKILAERTDSFLFTHWGFSGPAALDVSREISRHPHRKSLELVCDFLPDVTTEQLTDQLLKLKLSEGKQSVGNLLNSLFPKRMNEALLLASEIDPTQRNAELPKTSLLRLVQQIKTCVFPINGTLGFEKAEVTSGGVDLREIDSKTMESKLLSGLFFAGEVLDLDGRIGGFNFQSAFSTGWLAGQWV